MKKKAGGLKTKADREEIRDKSLSAASKTVCVDSASVNCNNMQIGLHTPCEEPDTE